MIVISIDPGRSKVGIALVNNYSGCMSRKVVSKHDIGAQVAKYKRDYPEAVIICGDATASEEILEEIRDYNIKDEITMVDERNTTIEARELYWARHKKPWFLFFIPKSMIKPSRNIDDYAAYAIALRYIKENRSGSRKKYN